MQIYLVGGAVRDQLLGYPVYDRDWVVVGATPEQMQTQGFTPVGQDFPVFLHPETGEEYALARTERKSGKGYTGFQYHASPDVTLEEDLIRRDLTINAMAQDDNGQIIDPYHGQQDLHDRVLRHVSPAFAEDPLRVLRVARFAARYHHLGFSIACETLTLMRQLSSSDELEHLTAERIWREFERALAERSPLVFIELLEKVGALAKLMPELRSAFAHPAYATLAQQLDNTRTASRFAALVCMAASLDDFDLAGVCERLRAPNRFRELAQLLNLYYPSLAQWQHSTGADKQALIKGADLVRRPERLANLLEAAQLIHGDAQLSQDIRADIEQILQGYQQLSPQVLMAEGFKGKALGEELARRQLEICERYS